MFYGSTIYKRAVDAVGAKNPIDAGRFLIAGYSGFIGSCIFDVLISANRLYGKKFQIYAMERSTD